MICIQRQVFINQAFPFELIIKLKVISRYTSLFTYVYFNLLILHVYIFQTKSIEITHIYKIHTYKSSGVIGW